MPLVVVSGPEKSGKTTLCEYLRDVYDAEVVHWGPVTSSYAFLGRLREDVKAKRLVVWDRSWVCEAVYAHYFRRDYSAFKDDWWLAEWVFGRAVQAAGTAVVLLGPSVRDLMARRDSTDLPIPVTTERALYHRYADEFGIPVVKNVYSSTYLAELARALVATADDPEWSAFQHRLPPFYCGPRWPRVVFVGQGRNEVSREPGAWLPFTTRRTARYGRILGTDAFRCGWTNVDGPLVPMDRAELVVACGKEAEKFVRKYTGQKNVLAVPHPAWLYRWGTASPSVAAVKADITAAVRAVLTPDREDKESA